MAFSIKQSSIPKHSPLPFWFRMVLPLLYIGLGVKVLVTGQIQSLRWSEDNESRPTGQGKGDK